MRRSLIWHNRLASDTIHVLYIIKQSKKTNKKSVYSLSRVR